MSAKRYYHQRSCAYTPQQNGVIGRKHRHQLETARALSFQSKVPLIYRGDCILCATYLINRMSLQSINNSTPYFKLYNKPASLDHLRTFGCLCFVSTTQSHRTKFTVRATPGVFLGYVANTKGYKVLDISSKKIIVSRDVKFYEKHFPYHFTLVSDFTSYPSSIYLPVMTPNSFSLDDFSFS